FRLFSGVRHGCPGDLGAHPGVEPHVEVVGGAVAAEAGGRRADPAVAGALVRLPTGPVHYEVLAVEGKRCAAVVVAEVLGGDPGAGRGDYSGVRLLGFRFGCGDLPGQVDPQRHVRRAGQGADRRLDLTVPFGQDAHGGPVEPAGAVGFLELFHE